MVKTTTWDASTGTVTVPARSAVVLVDREPVATATLVAPTKLLVKAGGSVTVAGKVTAADGSAPVGTVTVTDNGKVVASVELTAAAKGKVAVDVKLSGRGVHLIRTAFTGAGDYEGSRAAIPVPVLVY